MANIQLRVFAPHNRNFDGEMRVEVDGKPEKCVRILARGSRGPGDTQFLENGNTPTGEYSGCIFDRKTGKKYIRLFSNKSIKTHL
jgi:hypothetical protein